MQMSVERPPLPLLSRSRPMRASAHISCEQTQRRFRQRNALQRCEERTETCMRLRRAEVRLLLAVEQQGVILEGLQWQSSVAALQHTHCTGKAQLIERRVVCARLSGRSACCHFQESLSREVSWGTHVDALLPGQSNEGGLHQHLAAQVVLGMPGHLLGLLVVQRAEAVQQRLHARLHVAHLRRQLPLRAVHTSPSARCAAACLLDEQGSCAGASARAELSGLHESRWHVHEASRL